MYWVESLGLRVLWVLSGLGFRVFRAWDKLQGGPCRGVEVVIVTRIAVVHDQHELTVTVATRIS